MWPQWSELSSWRRWVGPGWLEGSRRGGRPTLAAGQRRRQSREAGRPLQAAARRRLSLVSRVRHWPRRRPGRGGSPSLYLSSGLSLPAAFSRHQAHSSRGFPSGSAQSSSLLVRCLQLHRGERKHLPLLLPPQPPSTAKTIVTDTSRAPPTTFPLNPPPPASKGMNLSVSRESPVVL